MQRQARPVSPSTITALAIALSVFTLLHPSSPASAAATCLAAPKSPPPQGHHWYYRTDRALQRKCWFLAAQDRSAPSAVAQAAPELQPTAAPSAPPVADNAADGPTKPELQAPQPSIAANASDTPEAAPATQQQPEPRTDTAERPESAASTPPRQQPASTPAVQEQASEQAPRAPDERPVPQPTVIADKPAEIPASTSNRTLRFAYLAVAAIGFVAGAIYCVALVRRRRTDVLNTALNAGTLNADMAPDEIPATASGPTFAPLPPMDLIARHDDVDEALQRFSQSWKRRAA